MKYNSYIMTPYGQKISSAYLLQTALANITTERGESLIVLEDKIKTEVLLDHRSLFSFFLTTKVKFENFVQLVSSLKEKWQVKLSIGKYGKR